MNPEYKPIGTVQDFTDGKAKRITLDAKVFAVIRIVDQFYAIDDACPHMEASLAFGTVEENSITCPRHGASFDIRTGKVETLPAIRGVYAYPIKVVDGTVYLKPTPISDSIPELFRVE